jgi:tRNA A-37 threonylcarbamoyl transferase component Bud32
MPPPPLGTGPAPVLPLLPTAVDQSQPSPDVPAPAFPGYEVLGVLGWGGMGVVYKARDLRRGQAVALKTMQRPDPAALYRFKQEFRALADLAHPNLVRLYDLVADAGRWFFTMELVEGVHFLRHVRGPAAGSGPVQAPDADGLARLRDVVRQLAEGVAFLHAAGKLHRDVKPSNVLVTPEGRVVLLDFGLAADLDRSGQHLSTERHVVGTAAYMAPEQAAGEGVSPASDCYAVGVMLYEALTGQLPFGGSSLHVLLDKQQRDPPAPHGLDANIPQDLSDLCMELLRREPAARPSAGDVLASLGPGGETRSAVVPPPAPRAGAPLVGRERHLTALEDAFQAMRRGQTVLAFVHGQSGMGKTALVQHFLDRLTQGRAAVVLAGRCYEQESVPYKALDGLVDALSRHLRRLPQPEVEAFLPRDVGALARVFPVLLQVEALARAPQRGSEIPDQQELRRRAFTALRELLARMGDRTALVLCIDDLQWGDVDSAALLAALLRPPDAPALLLLGCYRSEDADRSRCLRALREDPNVSGPERRDLALEPLTFEEARDLAATLLGAGPGTAAAEAVARESKGSPFFVHELVQALRAAAETDAPPSPGGVAALDEVLSVRIGDLPAEARCLLEVVAVAGRPLGSVEAFAAAGLEGRQRDAQAVLRSGRLLRATGGLEEGEVETYHDRIREAVMARLAPAVLRERHRQLAGVLEACGKADAEALAHHLSGAGEEAKASRYFAAAAEQAARTLAFDRAVKLFRRALEPGDAEGGAKHRLRGQLADALVNAGRGAEAAREYLAAAAGADPAEALELRRRAAGQFLLSGHVDEGYANLAAVLRTMDLHVPATPRRALFSLLLRRAQLRLRGLRFRERPASQVPPEVLRRIETCWSGAIGLSGIDLVRGADFQTRNLLLALRAGEPNLVARALAAEAGYLAAQGGKCKARATRLLDAADNLAQRHREPYSSGWVALAGAMAAFYDARWRDCVSFCSRAEKLFREQCVGVWWEQDTIQVFYLSSRYYLGDLAEVTQRLSRVLREVSERGDLYSLITALGTFGRPVVRLAADQPEEAHRELREVLGLLEKWSQYRLHLQHVLGIFSQVDIDLYQGQGTRAHQQATKLWSALSGSLLSRFQFFRILHRHVRARSMLAAAGSQPDLVRAAEREARALEREGMAWPQALAGLVRAGARAVRGDTLGARRLLIEAAAAFDRLEMRLHAAATRRRLGQLTGGDEGKALLDQGTATMTAQMVRNPDRMTALLAPGFAD